MKYLIVSLIAFAFLSCGENEASKPEVSKAKQADKQDLSNVHEMSYGIDDTIKMKSVENHADVQDGPFELLYSNGVIKAKGDIKDGKKSGLWESFYEDGTRWSSTYYTAGKPNGYSITYFKNGTVQYKGEYKNGERTGHWEFYLEDGSLEKSIDY